MVNSGPLLTQDTDDQIREIMNDPEEIRGLITSTKDPGEMREIVTAAFAIHHMMCVKRFRNREKENTETKMKKPKIEEPGDADSEYEEEDEYEEDEDEDDEEDQEAEGTPKKKIKKIDNLDDVEGKEEGEAKKKKNTKPRTVRAKKVELETDDTEQTLDALLQQNPPKIPPASVFGGDDVVGQCGGPFWKQLTVSDVNEAQSRITLGKQFVRNALFPLLEDSEIPNKVGTRVTVYGHDGWVQEMMFKQWSKKVYVLTSGWRQFCLHYGLQEHSDFVTIWMFRHKETHKICFVIAVRRFLVTRPLSSRITREVLAKISRDSQLCLGTSSSSGPE